MGKCNGKTQCGKRCKLKRKFNDFCSFHEYQRETCVICVQQIKSKTILDCEHSYCKKCILKWMCNNFSCPLCRQPITKDRLKIQSINYGIRNKLVKIMEQCYLTISALSDEEQEILENLGITKFTFMGDIDWEIAKTHIQQSILEKIPSRTRNVIVRTNDNYFNAFNTIYIFE